MNFALPKTDPVQFLISQKFPDWRRLDRERSADDPTSRHMQLTKEDRERLEQLRLCESELRSKPEDELMAMYRNALAENARQDEEGRFFNQPDAAADYEHWSKAAYWTLDEAVALVLGKCPGRVTWDTVKPTHSKSPFSERYKQILDLARRAKAAGQIRDPVAPSDFLAWAQSLEIAVPAELRTQMSKRGTPISDWKDQCEVLRAENDELKATIESFQKDALLAGNAYWQRLLGMAEKAVAGYPQWRLTKRKVQKTGNLLHWLNDSVGANSREADVIMKILTNHLDELN